MKLALDAMGGDDAPQAMVDGGLDYAAAHPQHAVILVGQDAAIRACLAGPLPANVTIEDAPEVIGMADKITALREKKNDSMNRCAQLVKDGRADGMVLCGNTGCSVAAAQLHLKRVPGVKRAGILTPLPNPKGHTWLCDIGANTVCRPEHLVQFAEMTVVLLECVYGKVAPKVGVLSNGEEDGKGTELTHETVELLRKTTLNVVGNVEGTDIYTGEIDVVVCDGFTGNIVLKTSEGLIDGALAILREEIMATWRTKIGGKMVYPAMRRFKQRTHWSVVGGCPLIGVDGVTIIGHGRSNRVAVFNALRQAARCVDAKFIELLRTRYHQDVGSAAAS